MIRYLYIDNLFISVQISLLASLVTMIMNLTSDKLMSITPKPQNPMGGVCGYILNCLILNNGKEKGSDSAAPAAESAFASTPEIRIKNIEKRRFVWLFRQAFFKKKTGVQIVTQLEVALALVPVFDSFFSTFSSNFSSLFRFLSLINLLLLSQR